MPKGTLRAGSTENALCYNSNQTSSLLLFSPPSSRTPSGAFALGSSVCLLLCVNNTGICASDCWESHCNMESTCLSQYVITILHAALLNNGTHFSLYLTRTQIKTMPLLCFLLQSINCPSGFLSFTIVQ